MASPVDTSVKSFIGLAGSAVPVLNGTVGSLIAVLKACLIDGYDLKTLTSLVALGGVMTATFSGTHSAQVDQVVVVAGVTGGPTGWAGANGEQKVVARPLATTVTWATALPDGMYTGTITMKIAPVGGWEMPFTGTNLAVFRSTDIQGTKMCMRIDDTNTTFARVIAYESMSDLNTGIGPFPTNTQVSGGGYWPKAYSATSVANFWIVTADARGFYYHVAPYSYQNPAALCGTLRYFGDAIPLKTGGDAFACLLNYSVTTSSSSQYDGAMDYGGTSLQCAFPRSYTGIGSSVLHVNIPYTGNPGNTSGADSTLGPFPSLVDGSLKLSKKYFATAITGQPPRAEAPGLYWAPQTLTADTFKSGDRVPGTGMLAGRNLLAINGGSPWTSPVAAANGTGVSFLDITGPWR